MRSGIACVCFLLLCSLGSRARAQEDVESDEYREVVATAVSELNGGHYEEALAQFSRAHELQPSARTERGIGLAAFALGDYVRALAALEAALADARRPLTDEQREQVQSLLDRSRGYVARLRVETVPSDASVVIQGQPVEPDAEGWVRLNAGRHEVVVSAPGHRDETRSITLRAGQEQTLTLELASDAAGTPAIVADSHARPGPESTPEAPARSSAGFSIVPAALAFGIAGAGAIVLAVAGAIALDLDASIGADCGEHAGRTCVESNVADLRVATTVADVGLGVAAVAGAAGVVLAIVSATTGGPEDVAVVPLVGPTAAGVMVHGAF